MKQALKAGEIIHFRGFPCRLLSDIEVESGTDLRIPIDELVAVDSAVDKARKDLFTKDS